MTARRHLLATRLLRARDRTWVVGRRGRGSGGRCRGSNKLWNEGQSSIGREKPRPDGRRQKGQTNRIEEEEWKECKIVPIYQPSAKIMRMKKNTKRTAVPTQRYMTNGVDLSSSA